MSWNRISIRGLAIASGVTAAAVGATVGVTSWADGPASSARAAAPVAAMMGLGSAKPAGGRIADLHAEAARHADARRKAAAKAKAEARAAAEAKARAAAEAKAAAEARQKAEASARAAREAKARASRSAARKAVFSGDPRSVARQLAASSYGWGASQFSCLDSLWQRESGWNVHASNASSGAYGIPQALPGSKMASSGPDWQNNAATQIKWGLSYIKGRYGSPCSAWGNSQAQGWY